MGIDGMPRRVYTYADVGALPLLNLIATAGSYVMLAGVLVFAWNVIVSALDHEPAGDDPWHANSLEWATSSPPPEHNFDALPPIRSERPVFDAPPPRAAARRRARVTIGLRLFISSAVFAIAIAMAYWLVAHEITGTFLLGFMAFALSFVAGYMIVAEREADLWGDRADAKRSPTPRASWSAPTRSARRCRSGPRWR